MTTFLDIFTHGRKLQGAVKSLPVEELESAVAKLNNIIERRKAKAEEEKKQLAEKRQKIEEFKQKMIDAGLNISDLQEEIPEAVATKTGRKRPVKYRLTQDNGDIVEWTGIGRMPVVFKHAVESGKSLEDFSIKN